MEIQDALRITYMEDVLRQEAGVVYKEQIFALNRSGLVKRTEGPRGLAGSLQAARFTVQARNNGVRLSMHYVAHNRFLDMRNPSRRRKKRGYNIYNRVVFPRIYRKMYVKIMYGFTLDVLAAMKGSVLGQ